MNEDVTVGLQPATPISNPTTNIGSGHIAGVGIGDQGEPGFSKKNQKKLKSLNKDMMKPRSSVMSFRDYSKDVTDMIKSNIRGK